MRISDWSSDVCSSDLHLLARCRDVAGEGDGGADAGLRLACCFHVVLLKVGHIDREAIEALAPADAMRVARGDGFEDRVMQGEFRMGAVRAGLFQDRKSVVSGKSVTVLVDLGGRRFLKKKKKIQYL